MSVPSVNDIIDVIIDLLAQDASRDPGELKADLEALGEHLHKSPHHVNSR